MGSGDYVIMKLRLGTQMWKAYHGRSVSFDRNDPEGVWTICQRKLGDGEFDSIT